MSKDIYTVWIKSVGLPQFENYGRCAVSWRICGPDGQIFREHTTLGPEFPVGPLLRALVEQAITIVLSVPNNSEVHFVSDFDSFWKAFHPEYKWLEKWRKDGFRKKPDHDRDVWKALSDELLKREITISAERPSSQQADHCEILNDLKLNAQDAPDPKPKPHPGDPPDSNGVYDNPEWLLQRALARDI